MKKPRYWIPTTEGPVEITAISEETPGLPSVLCLANTFQALPLSRAYDEFVRAPTGIIEKLTGKNSFRTDISAPISQGNSWHLGICAAHMCQSFDLEDSHSDHIWASGAINPSLDILPVTHIAEKWGHSEKLINEARLSGEKIDVFLHPQNADQLPNCDSDVARVHRVTTIQDVTKILKLITPSAKNKPELTPYLQAKGLVSLGMLIAIFASILLIVPFGIIASWNDLEKQGRYRELGRSLNQARVGDSLVNINAAYFFTRNLYNKSRLNKSAVSIQIIQKVEPEKLECLGGNAVLSEQNSLPEWVYANCDYTLKIKNNSRKKMNIWLSIISQLNDSQINRHAWQTLTLLEDEVFYSPPFSINSSVKEDIYLVAIMTDRPNAEPYRWFNTLSQYPKQRSKLEQFLRSHGLGLQLSTALKPEGSPVPMTSTFTTTPAQNNPS